MMRSPINPSYCEPSEDPPILPTPASDSQTRASSSKGGPGALSRESLLSAVVEREMLVRGARRSHCCRRSSPVVASAAVSFFVSCVRTGAKRS